MKIRKYTGRALLLLFWVLAGIGAVDTFIPRGSAHAGTVPVLYVDARGRTGAEVGTALGNLVKAEFPDIRQKMDAYLAQFIGLIASVEGVSSREIFDGYAVPRINAIKPNIEQRYRNEVSALGSRLGLSDTDALGDGGLSLNELWALQLIADIGRETNCSGFGVFGDYASSGSPAVGRNLDWYSTSDLRSLQAVTVYVYEHRALVNIGFAGLAAVITGYNSDGLFGGILDSPMGNDYPDWPYGKRSYVFDLRNALESCTRISDAVGLLYNQPYAFSHNILFADTTDVRVLEHPQGVSGQLRTAGSRLNPDLSWGKSKQIAVVNFFALPGYINERSGYNLDRWNRFRELAGFSLYHKATINDLESIMLDTGSPYPIFNAQTVQSMVFTPADKKLYMYARGVHASTAMEQIPVSGGTGADGSHQPLPFLFFLLED